MKKFLFCITGAICLLAVFSFAADQPAAPSNPSAVMKPAHVKITKMNARGKVVDITGKSIKIERSIKGSVEIMEFTLENPAQDIVVDDFVKIDYSVKEGTLTVSKVAKLRAGKNSGKKETKQVIDKPAPITK